MLIRNTCVHDYARVVVTIVEDHRIDLAAPALSHNLEILFRIAPRAHRPDHFLKPSWVDITVDHDRPAVPISDGNHLARQNSSLPGMSEIPLLDADHVKAASRPGFVNPDSCNLRNGSLLESIP